MSRRALVLAALLPLAACGDGPPLPPEDLLLAVTPGVREAVTGRGFPLTVVRVWNKDLEPTAWDDRALAPLVLRHESTERREDERRVEETRRYRAHAMSLGDVNVPAVKWTARPKAGGPERVTTSARIRLRVSGTLDPSAPRAPEYPGEPLAEPFPWAPWAAAGGIAVLGAASIFLRRRRRTRVHGPSAVESTPPRSPHAWALERLREVAARAPLGVEEVRADVEETSTILRDYVAARFRVPARERTSEEVLEALRAAPGDVAGSASRLSALFARCDGVKYAAHVPAPAERVGLLRDATAFVESTAFVEPTAIVESTAGGGSATP